MRRHELLRSATYPAPTPCVSTGFLSASTLAGYTASPFFTDLRVRTPYVSIVHKEYHLSTLRHVSRGLVGLTVGMDKPISNPN